MPSSELTGRPQSSPIPPQVKISLSTGFLQPFLFREWTHNGGGGEMLGWRHRAERALCLEHQSGALLQISPEQQLPQHVAFVECANSHAPLQSSEIRDFSGGVLQSGGPCDNLRFRATKFRATDPSRHCSQTVGSNRATRELVTHNLMKGNRTGAWATIFLVRSLDNSGIHQN